MSDVNIRVISIDDWEIYKSLRLDSLKDSPDSFSATFKREAEYSDDEWKSRLDLSDRAAISLPLLAEVDGTPCGLAWGIIHEPSTKFAHVYQMWVRPGNRGMGIGHKLLENIISWANKSNLTSLVLSVTTSNSEAVSLYKSFGFLPAGESEPLRPGSALQAQPMILELCANVA